MSQKFVYLLDHYIYDQPTHVGIFTSRQRAESYIKKLPPKYQYTLYKLPLNVNLTQGKKLEEQQGIFDHWHYGTYLVDFEKYDETAKSFEKNTQVQFNWPD